MSLVKAMLAERLLKWFFDRAVTAISKKLKRKGRANGTTEESEKGNTEEGCD